MIHNTFLYRRRKDEVMSPSKKNSPSKTKQSNAKSSSDLPQKTTRKKTETKKHESPESSSPATQASQKLSQLPSGELARKATSKKVEQKKQELMEALTHTTPASQESSSRIAPNPEKKYFQDLGAQIAQRAYELHERRGKVHGHDFEDWLEAERQILSEKNLRT
jgi:hypothetical protein